MLLPYTTLVYYGPAALAIVVEGGDTQQVDLRGSVRLGITTEGGAQEPDLHATLLVGWGVEVEGIGEVEAFGMRGSVRLGIEVDVAAQPTVFDIVQGVLNAMAAQYNLTDTIGAKINAAGGGSSPVDIAAAVLSAAQTTPIEANVKQVNGITVTGDGQTGSEWGPA